MRKLFGTDGIRGVANLEPMTSEMAMQLGRAAAHLFMRRAGRHQIVIGKDTRISGYMLESALTAGICSMGVDVLLVGPMPTPAVVVQRRLQRWVRVAWRCRKTLLKTKDDRARSVTGAPDRNAVSTNRRGVARRLAPKACRADGGWGPALIR